jgi:pterin-4a-carbinolamine dehydratase
MTENGTWTEEYILASDVWGVEKSITPLSDEEQLAKWEQAVAVLKDLGPLAETLWNDPLILALTDALVRVKEEQARAEDRLARPAGGDLHPREEERVRGLLRRSDALGFAHTAISDGGWVNTDIKASALETLEGLLRETNEQFKRYKQELGISD